MNMFSRFISTGMVLLGILHYAYADQPGSITDRINARSFKMLDQTRESIDEQMQSCEGDNTGVVTIYTTNGKAQVGIDVEIDGNAVGSLITHYPDDGPACKTPSSDGVITVILQAGKHTLDAKSLNLVWPGYSFTVKKCQCLVLPLS